MNRARVNEIMKNEMRAFPSPTYRVRITGAAVVGDVDVVTYDVHAPEVVGVLPAHSSSRWAVYARDGRSLAGGMTS